MAKSREKAAAPPAPRARYHSASGGRKMAQARVWLTRGEAAFTVNGKEYRVYFPMPKHQEEVMAPLAAAGVSGCGVQIKVRGGGIHAQAQAIRHALAKAIVRMDPETKKRLRREGFITRDARVVERKKYGLKKARRAPQWQKR